MNWQLNCAEIAVGCNRNRRLHFSVLDLKAPNTCNILIASQKFHTFGDLQTEYLRFVENFKIEPQIELR